MKTFILGAMLVLTAASGVVAASQTAEAGYQPSWHTVCGYEFVYGYGYGYGGSLRYICRQRWY